MKLHIPTRMRAVAVLLVSLLWASPAPAVATAVDIENPVRVASTFEWCDCGKGLHNVTVWPGSDKSKQRTVSPSSTNEPVWIDFGSPVATMGWRCDGMDKDLSLIHI